MTQAVTLTPTPRLVRESGGDEELDALPPPHPLPHADPPITRACARVCLTCWAVLATASGVGTAAGTDAAWVVKGLLLQEAALAVLGCLAAWCLSDASRSTAPAVAAGAVALHAYLTSAVGTLLVQGVRNASMIAFVCALPHTCGRRLLGACGVPPGPVGYVVAAAAAVSLGVVVAAACLSEFHALPGTAWTIPGWAHALRLSALFIIPSARGVVGPASMGGSGSSDVYVSSGEGEAKPQTTARGADAAAPRRRSMDAHETQRVAGGGDDDDGCGSVGGGGGHGAGVRVPATAPAPQTPPLGGGVEGGPPSQEPPPQQPLRHTSSLGSLGHTHRGDSGLFVDTAAPALGWPTPPADGIAPHSKGDSDHSAGLTDSAATPAAAAAHSHGLPRVESISGTEPVLCGTPIHKPRTSVLSESFAPSECEGGGGAVGGCVDDDSDVEHPHRVRTPQHAGGANQRNARRSLIRSRGNSPQQPQPMKSLPVGVSFAMDAGGAVRGGSPPKRMVVIQDEPLAGGAPPPAADVGPPRRLLSPQERHEDLARRSNPDICGSPRGKFGRLGRQRQLSALTHATSAMPPPPAPPPRASGRVASLPPVATPGCLACGHPWTPYCAATGTLHPGVAGGTPTSLSGVGASESPLSQVILSVNDVDADDGSGSVRGDSIDVAPPQQFRALSRRSCPAALHDVPLAAGVGNGGGEDPGLWTADGTPSSSRGTSPTPLLRSVQTMPLVRPTTPLTPNSPLPESPGLSCRSCTFGGRDASFVRTRSRVRRESTYSIHQSSSTKTIEKTVKWKRGALLGQGGFGQVHLGLNLETGELMAVKNIDFSSAAGGKDIVKKLEQLRQEIQIMQPLDHAHIVKYFFTERVGTSVNIFMEYIPGGSLKSLLGTFGPLSEEAAVQYTFQLLGGIRHLHNLGIVHRDVKGANILLTVEGAVKLADFGAAAKCMDVKVNATNTTAAGGDRSQSIIEEHGVQGTPFWMAPEVLRGEEHDWEADIWSLGCTVMEMLTAEHPWAHLKLANMKVLHWICDEGEAIVLPDGITAASHGFLEDCLRRDPCLRPAAAALIEHHYFYEPHEGEDEVGDSADSIGIPQTDTDTPSPAVAADAPQPPSTHGPPDGPPAAADSDAPPAASGASSLSPRGSLTRRHSGPDDFGVFSSGGVTLVGDRSRTSSVSVASPPFAGSPRASLATLFKRPPMQSAQSQMSLGQYLERRASLVTALVMRERSTSVPQRSSGDESARGVPTGTTASTAADDPSPPSSPDDAETVRSTVHVLPQHAPPPPASGSASAEGAAAEGPRAPGGYRVGPRVRRTSLAAGRERGSTSEA